MITPEYLQRIVHATEDSVSVLHEYLIRRIAKHIAALIDTEDLSFMPSNITMMHKMMESGVVYEDIQNEIIAKYPMIQADIKQAFLNSAAEISEANTRFEKEIVRVEHLSVNVPDYDVKGTPTNPKALNLTEHETRLLEANYKRTEGTVKNLTRTTAKACQTTYIDACDKAMMKVQHGVSPSLAVTEAIKEVAEKGVGVVIYGTNYRSNIEVAISRAVRTGINQTNSEITLQRCAELGVSHVKVSEHLGARVTDTQDYKDHAWWQGKVYSLNWNDDILAGYSHDSEGHIKEIADAIGEVKEKYPDFIKTTGYGDILGLCGINCRHTFSPFYPNIQLEPEQNIDYEASRKRYKEQQEQRALERGIRKTKREIAGLEGSGLTNIPDVQGQLKDAKARLKTQLNTYYDFCKTHRLNADGSRMITADSIDIGR